MNHVKNALLTFAQATKPQDDHLLHQGTHLGVLKFLSPGCTQSIALFNTKTRPHPQ